EGSEDELHRDEADGDPGERGEESRPRGRSTDPAGDQPSRGLDDPRDETGDEADLPCDLRRLLPRNTGAGRPLLVRRAHDEEDEGEEADRVDAEGEGGDVVAAEASR